MSQEIPMLWLEVGTVLMGLMVGPLLQITSPIIIWRGSWSSVITSSSSMKSWWLVIDPGRRFTVLRKGTAINILKNFGILARYAVGLPYDNGILFFLKNNEYDWHLSFTVEKIFYILLFASLYMLFYCFFFCWKLDEIYDYLYYKNIDFR